QRHGCVQEFHHVLGEVPLESWTTVDFFPEENRIAELVEGQKPQPAMMFGKHKRRAAPCKRVAVTLFDGPAGFFSGDGQVLFFDGQITPETQADWVHLIGRLPGLVEIFYAPDEPAFEVAPRAEIFHVKV